MDAERQHLSVVLLGPHGSGKSTLAAHLSVLSGSEHRKHLDRLEKECVAAGVGRERKYAWLLDRSATERSQGSSTHAVHFRLETVPSKRVLTLFVVAGRPSLRKATPAIAQSDVGVLVLDGNRNELETSLGKDGLAMKHALLAYTFGLKQLVVVVNKMDSSHLRHSRAYFEEAKVDILRALKKVGYNAGNTTVIPASGINGDNLLKEPSDTMPWWKGPTLMHLLGSIVEVPQRFPEKPLRFVSRDVASPNVLCGRVEQGVVRVGQVVTVAPRMITSTVESIQMYGKALTEASAGDVVGLTFAGIDVAELDRAHVVGSAVEPPRRVAQFVARMVILRQCTIREGFSPVMVCHTASVPCRFAKLLQKTDMKTKKKTVLHPQALSLNEQADVLLVPLRPICADVFDTVPSLGRFAILDMNNIVAVGFIRSVSWEASSRIRVTRERVERLENSRKE